MHGDSGHYGKRVSYEDSVKWSIWWSACCKSLQIHSLEACHRLHEIFDYFNTGVHLITVEGHKRACRKKLDMWRPESVYLVFFVAFWIVSNEPPTSKHSTSNKRVTLFSNHTSWVFYKCENVASIITLGQRGEISLVLPSGIIFYMMVLGPHSA